MDARQVRDLMLDWKYEYTNYLGDSDFRDIDCWYEWEELEGETVAVPGLGLVEVVENFGGEGQGEHMHLVFKVEHSGEWPSVKYYKVDGYYSSYGGSEWDGNLYEVKPVQRMVTFYEKLGE